MLASGLSVELVGNDVLATRGRARLARRDHERLQPARQHGRARRDARGRRVRLLRDRRGRAEPESDARPRRSRSRSAAPASASCRSTCAPAGAAAVFMGDSGSQVLGFALASLGLASSWTAAGTTVATIAAAAARARDPDPRHDARHVRRAARAAAGHAGRQGPHLAPARLLRALRAAGGARCSRCSRRCSARRRSPTTCSTTRGSRPSACSSRFVAARPVRELPRRPRGALAPRRAGRPPSLLRALCRRSRAGWSRCSSTSRSSAPRSSPPTCSSSTARARRPARRLPRGAAGPARRALRRLRPVRHLPPRLALRRRARPARDRGGVVLSALVALGDRRATRSLGGFPRAIFVVDALLCTALVGGARGSRCALLPDLLRAAGREPARADAHRRRRPLRPQPRARAARDAGTSASSASSTTTRACAGAAIHGVTVLGGLDEIGDAARAPGPTRCSSRSRTRRRAPARRRRTRATAAGVPCRFVRRHDRDDAAAARRGPRRVTADRDQAATAWLRAAAARVAYLVLAALYAWQASQHETPTIFTDELEFTQISRSIAETGTAARAAASRARFASLVRLPGRAGLVARRHRHGLRRDQADRRARDDRGDLPRLRARAPRRLAAVGALRGASATAAAPALSYAPFLVEEPLAYPAATLALLLIARAADRGRRGGRSRLARRCLHLALRSSGRSSRSCSPCSALVLLALALADASGCGGGARRGRVATGWAPSCSVVGALLRRARRCIGHRSADWYVTTAFFKERMLEYGLWAAGALAIGLGVLPLVAALAASCDRASEHARPRRRRVRRADALRRRSLLRPLHGRQGGVPLDDLRDRRRRAQPDLPRAALFASARRCCSSAGDLALARSRRPTAFVALPRHDDAVRSSTSTPTTRRPGSRSSRSRTGSRAGRQSTIETRSSSSRSAPALALVALAARARSARSALASAPSIAALVLGWNLTTEIYAANGERQPPTQLLRRTSPKPPDWVDRRRRAASRRSTSASGSPTRTRSGCSSSGTARSRRSGASTAPRPGPARR